LPWSLASVPVSAARSCQQLLADGYRVAGLARGRTGAEDLAQVHPEHYLALTADLTDPAQLDAAVTAVESQWGPVTPYFHNASSFLRQPFLNTPQSVFESLWCTTCLGAVQGAQRVLPGMLSAGQGALLFIGATASVKPGAEFAAFGAAKFALRGLAQSLARELGRQGIHLAHLIIDGVLWSERARRLRHGPRAVSGPGVRRPHLRAPARTGALSLDA
jgi:NAD(P)-dependent dehydrogenase (short-subunit alcohol dehydrogenase family)